MSVPHEVEAVAVASSTFDNVIVPLNVRGPGIELELTVTPSSDSSEVVIESLQLIHSRKGAKVSRG